MKPEPVPSALVPELSEGDWPLERRRKAAARTFCTRFLILAKEVVDMFGSRGVDAVSRVLEQRKETWSENFVALCAESYSAFGDKALDAMGRQGRKWCEQSFPEAARALGITGSEPADIARYFYLVNNIIGYETEMKQVSPDEALFRIKKCTLCDAGQTAKACKAGMTYEARAIEFLNPNLEFEATSFLADDAPYTEVVFRRKKKAEP